MPYKDKEKQKQAQRERTRRYRDKAKGVTKGVTSQGVTQGVTLPDNYGLEGCGCRHCRAVVSNGLKAKGVVLNHGPYKDAGQLEVGELNRVSLPGDEDYVGVGYAPPAGGAPQERYV